MSTLIITSEPKDYTPFITQFVHSISECDVKGIAMVALTETDSITSYWNMNLKGKAEAENAIRYDTIDQFIKANIDRYFESGESE